MKRTSLKRGKSELSKAKGKQENVATPQTIGITELKAEFSRLVEAAANGTEIIITKAGKPRARLIALG
jgi:prevent-host-death family protein